MPESTAAGSAFEGRKRSCGAAAAWRGLHKCTFGSLKRGRSQSSTPHPSPRSLERILSSKTKRRRRTFPPERFIRPSASSAPSLLSASSARPEARSHTSAALARGRGRPEAVLVWALERGLRPVPLRGAGARPEARPEWQERVLRTVPGEHFIKGGLGETDK